MKRSIAFALAALAAAAAASCASAPAAQPAGAEAQRPAPSPRTLRVPVLISEKVFLADGTLDRSIGYSYDDSLRVLLKKTTSDPARPAASETLVRAVSGTGVVETRTDGEGQLLSRKTISLDAAGHELSESVEGAKGAKGSSSAWTYDARGRMKDWTVLSDSGAALTRTAYSYDGDRLAKAEIFGGSGELEERISYEYDGEGRLLSRTTASADGSIEEKAAFRYEGKALVEESDFKGAASLQRRIVHEVGPEGADLSLTVYDASGAVREKRTFEYAWRVDTLTAGSR